MNLQLTGQRALVTGSTAGIGFAIAQALAAEGAHVVVNGRSEAGVAAALQRLQTAVPGARLSAAAADAATAEGCAQLMALSGEVDILVNNAGRTDFGVIEGTSLEEFNEVVSASQTSVFLGMKACGPLLKASGRGSVINMSSILGTTGGLGGSPAYSAAKGAVRTLTKSTAIRWATKGVRVNSLHPGFTDTPMLEHAAQTGVLDRMLDATPMGRLGHPSEIAAAVAFLASDDASFMTGEEIHVDGGFTAR